jgi:hypothetical protein
MFQDYFMGGDSELGGIVLVIIIVLAHQLQLRRTRQSLKPPTAAANQLAAFSAAASLDDVLRGMKSAYTASGLRDVRRPRDFRAQHVSAFLCHLKSNGGGGPATSNTTPAGKRPRTPSGPAKREARPSPAPGATAAPTTAAPRPPPPRPPALAVASPAATTTAAAGARVPEEVEGEFGPSAGAAALAQLERAWHGVAAAYSDATITCYHQPPPVGGR